MCIRDRHFRFIVTKCNESETLVIDGYMLRVTKRTATKKYWTCEVGDCKVTVISDGAQVVKNLDTSYSSTAPTVVTSSVQGHGLLSSSSVVCVPAPSTAIRL